MKSKTVTFKLVLLSYFVKYVSEEKICLCSLTKKVRQQKGNQIKSDTCAKQFLPRTDYITNNQMTWRRLFPVENVLGRTVVVVNK